jgi:hypothetical protein
MSSVPLSGTKKYSVTTDYHGLLTVTEPELKQPAGYYPLPTTGGKTALNSFPI